MWNAGCFDEETHPSAAEFVGGPERVPNLHEDALGLPQEPIRQRQAHVHMMAEQARRRWAILAILRQAHPANTPPTLDPNPPSQSPGRHQPYGEQFARNSEQAALAVQVAQILQQHLLHLNTRAQFRFNAIRGEGTHHPHDPSNASTEVRRQSELAALRSDYTPHQPAAIM